jgi:ABC-2 type transport system permease protein
VTDAPIVARRPVEDRPVRIVSARPSVWMRFKAIWDARELLVHFVITDIKIKYKSSALGLLWSLFAPSLTLAIYWLVFSVMLRNSIPQFVIYLFSGLIVWNFFFNIVSTSTGIVVERAAVVKKVAFPREILALSTVGTSLIFFTMQSSVMAVFLIVSHHAPDFRLLWLIPISLFALALVGGAIGIAFSAINVYLRDLKHLVDVFLQLWFFLTPIVYSFENQVSLKLHRHGVTWLYLLNPVTPIVMTFQRVLYANEVVHAAKGASSTPGHPLQTGLIKALPTWPATTYLALNLALIAIGVVGMFVAVSIFGRLEGNFAEEL